jgi:hypothetical protein
VDVTIIADEHCCLQRYYTEQEPTHECPDNFNDDVFEKSKSGTLCEFSGKPPGQSSNDQESNHGITFCLREKL